LKTANSREKWPLNLFDALTHTTRYAEIEVANAINFLNFSKLWRKDTQVFWKNYVRRHILLVIKIKICMKWSGRSEIVWKIKIF